MIQVKACTKPLLEDANYDHQNDDSRKAWPLYLGTVHFLGGRGGWWDLGGGSMRKKMAFEGGPSQKNKGKRGGHVKYFNKTLKWRNV